MQGVMQVIQRINGIESRFRQPANIVSQQHLVNEKSFSEFLSQAEKQTSNSSRNSASLSNVSKDNIANLVQTTALKYGVNPKLALAVAEAESSLNQSAVSSAGAVGVMQLMPDTARGLGVKNINNLYENVDGGVRYLRQMLDTFGGDVNKAVAAYNAGPGAVKSYNGLPPYKETQEYVARVNELAR